MQYLLYLIFIYGLLVAFSYSITFLQLCQVTLQYPIYEMQAVANIPVYIQKLFLIPIAELQEFGFQPCCYLQVKPMLRIYPNIAWEILLYNETFNSYAKVGIHHRIEPVHLFDIEFYTFFTDKTCLVTINGKGDTVIGEIPYFILQDIYTAQTSLQWQFHQGRLRQLKTNKVSQSFSFEAFIQRLQVYLQNYLDSLIKLKYVLPISRKDLFRLNGKLALKLTQKIIQGNNKNTSMIKQRREQLKSNPRISVEIPIELEVEGFRRMEQLQRGIISRKLRPWLILGSFGLFVITSTKYFEPQTLIIFVAALIFHEAGHLLAMKLCGYQDASLIFLPFLGAVATARKDNATVTQKFFVSLAGPIPGLVIGLGLAFIFRDASYLSWGKQASWILICLNLFNLLPIYPLDGGQIADILLFSRFPYSNVLFKVFGVIFISILGLFHPALFLLAILLLFNIINSYRTAQISFRLRNDSEKGLFPNSENTLSSLFKNLQQFDYQKLPFNRRYLLVKSLLEKYHCSDSKRTTRMILASVYCSSLLVGILGSLQVIILDKIVNQAAGYVGIQREIRK